MKKLIIILAVTLSNLGLYSQSKNEVLFSHVQNNETEKATALLKAGGDANYFVTGTPYKTVSLLITAVINKNLDMAKALINNKADVNWQDDQKCSAIIYAASTGQTEMVKLLLQNGAFVNDNNGNGKSVISEAKVSGNEELIKYLEEVNKSK